MTMDRPEHKALLHQGRLAALMQKEPVKSPNG